MGLVEPGDDMEASVQSGAHSADGVIKYTFTFAQRLVTVGTYTPTHTFTFSKVSDRGYLYTYTHLHIRSKVSG